MSTRNSGTFSCLLFEETPFELLMVFQKAVFLVMSLSISHHFKMSYLYMWFKGVVGGFEIKTCLFPFCGSGGSRLVPWYFRLELTLRVFAADQ